MATVEEIYGGMMTTFAQKTGVELRESCDLSVRMYAVAAQVAGLYSQMDWVKKQCFPQTASGQQLDYHGALRGLARKEATCARGMIRFFVASGQTVARTIPVGTVGMTAGLVRFVTTQEATVPVGASYVNVAAQAEVAGEQGNVAALTIIAMSNAPVGVERCSNLTAFTGGMNAEEDEGLRKRIMESFYRLPNGVNVAYYQQEALEYDGVEAVSVLPCARGVGTVDVVVSASGGIPDNSLVAGLGDYFEERREIAVQVLVRAPDALQLAVRVKISVAEGYSQEAVEAVVEDALTAWFGGSGLGRPVLLAQLSTLVFSCEGVANCKIIQPAADVAVEADELPVLSNLIVEVLS